MALTEYAVSVEFWVQTEDEADEAKVKLGEALAAVNLNDANVSGWDIVHIEAL